MTDSTLATIFKDTFYYGELTQAGQIVDLVEAPVPFEPMIDREMFFMVQELARTRKQLVRIKHDTRFCPLGTSYTVMCVSLINRCKLVSLVGEIKYLV